MKKMFVVFVTLCFLSTAMAHGGRTNKKGCHKQRGHTSHCHR